MSRQSPLGCPQLDKEETMLLIDYSLDSSWQTTNISLVEQVTFQRATESCSSVQITSDFFPTIPKDFVEAMNDFNTGNVVGLDTALNEEPPNSD